MKQLKDLLDHGGGTAIDQQEILKKYIQENAPKRLSRTLIVKRHAGMIAHLLDLGYTMDQTAECLSNALGKKIFRTDIYKAFRYLRSENGIKAAKRRQEMMQGMTESAEAADQMEPKKEECRDNTTEEKSTLAYPVVTEEPNIDRLAKETSRAAEATSRPSQQDPPAEEYQLLANEQPKAWERGASFRKIAKNTAKDMAAQGNATIFSEINNKFGIKQ